jgi:LmbE family N-acetylglucosaminyl deacetylase
LAIFAHPDDESFGPGGTLAKYAADGYQVGLVTLTRGEAGSLGISQSLKPEVLGRQRTQELERAAEQLGISYLKIYDQPDKNLASVSDDDGILIIQQEIESFQPDIIITFHENGISGHPDHKAVTRWILKAVDQTERATHLYYYGILPEHVEMLPQRELYAMPEQDVTHRIDVDAYIDKKKAAIACHKTQEELWKTLQDSPLSYEKLNRWEHFVQVRPLPSKRHMSQNLHDEIFIS